MKVIICGGGIMSACTAYFLLEHGVSCIVIERNKVACAASGKAGGFLAKDWCGQQSLRVLAEASFEVHEALSDALNGEKNYDYRKLTAYALEIKENQTSQNLGNNEATWLDGSGVDSKSRKQIGSTETVAQLHPFKFVHTLTKSNLAKGMQLIEGEEVSELNFTGNGKKIKGVKLSSGTTIDGDAIVIAMGPWSGLASKWHSSIPSFYGQKAHSILIKPSHPVPAEALFTEFGEFSPEFYPRPDGEVYVCGMAENPLPSRSLMTSDNISVSHRSCEKIKEMAGMVSTCLKYGEVVCSQACYLPLTHDGLPLIGAFSDVSGLYIAAGHGCWGILNSAATGKALAQLIATGDSEINIQAFDPNRFVV